MNRYDKPIEKTQILKVLPMPVQELMSMLMPLLQANKERQQHIWLMQQELDKLNSVSLPDNAEHLLIFNNAINPIVDELAKDSDFLKDPSRFNRLMTGLYKSIDYGRLQQLRSQKDQYALKQLYDEDMAKKGLFNPVVHQTLDEAILGTTKENPYKFTPYSPYTSVLDELDAVLKALPIEKDHKVENGKIFSIERRDDTMMKKAFASLMENAEPDKKRNWAIELGILSKTDSYEVAMAKVLENPDKYTKFLEKQAQTAYDRNRVRNKEFKDYTLEAKNALAMRLALLKKALDEKDKGMINDLQAQQMRMGKYGMEVQSTLKYALTDLIKKGDTLYYQKILKEYNFTDEDILKLNSADTELKLEQLLLDVAYRKLSLNLNAAVEEYKRSGMKGLPPKEIQELWVSPSPLIQQLAFRDKDGNLNKQLALAFIGNDAKVAVPKGRYIDEGVDDNLNLTITQAIKYHPEIINDFEVVLLTGLDKGKALIRIKVNKNGLDYAYEDGGLRLEDSELEDRMESIAGDIQGWKFWDKGSKRPGVSSSLVNEYTIEMITSADYSPMISEMLDLMNNGQLTGSVKDTKTLMPDSGFNVNY